jgi:hypothetical protein
VTSAREFGGNSKNMDNRTGSRTNALEYSRVYEHEAPRISLLLHLRAKLRSFGRWFSPIDDFDWDDYPAHYRAENKFNRRFFTDDLRDVEFTFTNGKLYLLADCKPLNPTHRCLLEAICNLPDIGSIAEIGVGGGRYVANLRLLLGQDVRLFGYDRARQQITFFGELFPDVFRETTTGVMDVTEQAIREEALPDVVYASTVLMHIQRPDAYRSALRNLLASARNFAVLMDNWGAHDYYADLVAQAERDTAMRLYTYDSGANVAIVIAVGGRTLGAPYVPLTDPAALQRYLRCSGER